MKDTTLNARAIGDQHAGVVGYIDDPELLRQCAASGQMDACDMAALGLSFDVTAGSASEVAAPAFDLLAHLVRQRAFSERTFGPGARADGVVAHIRKELTEVEANPRDVEEWIDVVILALDGAWRAGFSPEEIVEALVAKQAKNEGRTWPDWRTVAAGAPIEHVKAAQA